MVTKCHSCPKGFDLIAATDSCPIAGMAHRDKPWFGIQFHPEVTHTLQGSRIFEHFALELCGCEALWTPANIVEDALTRVRAQVGNDRVLLGLSGGVDSSVVAALLHRAIGEQLTCVFVDNGLLRLHEGDQVMDMFAKNMGVKVIRADAEERFLTRLQGENDPEAKRKIIGNTFIDVFDEEANKITNVKWLAQGTIYPDVIESAGSKTGKAHVIKSHHNVGGLPDDMALELVEPLRELFKDEVREIGVELVCPRYGVSPSLPRAGLGVRDSGRSEERVLRAPASADAIFIEELRTLGWYDKDSQAFAVFLPVKSVGWWVMAPLRVGYCIRAVQTVDFMTARWAHLPYELLETCLIASSMRSRDFARDLRYFRQTACDY